MKIVKTDGRWLLDGKQYPEISGDEKIFFDKFIALMKEEKEMEYKRIHEVENRAIDRVIIENLSYKFEHRQARMNVLF